jgi:hypothetical protein
MMKLLVAMRMSLSWGIPQLAEPASYSFHRTMLSTDTENLAKASRKPQELHQTQFPKTLL